MIKTATFAEEDVGDAWSIRTLPEDGHSMDLEEQWWLWPALIWGSARGIMARFTQNGLTGCAAL